MRLYQTHLSVREQRFQCLNIFWESGWVQVQVVGVRESTEVARSRFSRWSKSFADLRITKLMVAFFLFCLTAINVVAPAEYSE